MKLSLIVLTPGKQQGKILNISLAQFLIGRDVQCHLRPASPMISKRHCALIQRDGKVFIRDFASTNGTLLNEKPVEGEVELHHDDQLKVGPLHFAVRLEASAPVSSPTPAPPTKATATVSAAAEKTVHAGKGGKAAKPVASPTPPPKTALSPETPANGAEDDIAAMLLSLEGEDTPVGANESIVPDGSTVMDVPAPGSEGNQAAKDDKDKEKKNPLLGNTSGAAKSILEKYMRRPRSSS